MRQVYDAVRRGDLDAVHQIVEANPSFKDIICRGWTPLQLAAYCGEVGIAQYLVGEAGVDKDKVDARDRTSLLIAAWQGHMNVVRYLVEAGADKEKVNDIGWTPLMAAAFYGRLGVVRYLLKEGVDNTLKSKYGYTALFYAEERGYVEVADALREYLPGGVVHQRRDAVNAAVLNQKDLGPDVAQLCGEFVMYMKKSRKRRRIT